ncbi:hypothetical protein FACS1894199_04370 [Bacteroidia bacterium]|nr:hypothetical protein FACS1894199_04370 [Bacteroidia bacterium]
MKKVLNVGIGGKSFVIDEDAYQRLDLYLENFRRKANMGIQTKELMDELEVRIAELLAEALSSKQEVVNIVLINRIVSQLGMPDGSREENAEREFQSSTDPYPQKKLYRDPDTKKIGGVSGGLAAYFCIDIVIVRVLFIVILIVGSLGFWLYLILWIVSPLAVSATQKCEMRGLPVTAENIRRFSRNI